MKRVVFSVGLLLATTTAFAQAPVPASPGQDPQSSFYPAPPPETAPKVDQGAPVQGLSSPLAGGEQKITRTAIDSDAEAQLFGSAGRIVWGRYAKLKGAKPGEVVITKQNGLWTVKGRIESAAPGTEGDWASIDGVVERISAGNVTVRGEVAFRVAKAAPTPCKVSGLLNFKRAGKSEVWRLAEGDNPCDGAQEMLDLVYEKPVEKKPVPQAAPAKRT